MVRGNGRKKRDRSLERKTSPFLVFFLFFASLSFSLLPFYSLSLPPTVHLLPFPIFFHFVNFLSLQSLRLNRVDVEESTGPPRPGVKPRKKTFDLNAGDNFWHEQKGSPFPEVAEAVQVKLEEYRNREEEVKRLKAAMGLDAGDEAALSLISDNTSRLTSAVRYVRKNRVFSSLFLILFFFLVLCRS